MPRSAEQKIKLLILYDLLQRQTDEENPMSTEEVIMKLLEKGIPVERKALLSDVKTLNEWGFEVMSYKKKSYYFYVEDRQFNIAELRILIDAIQTANFISEEKTAEFTNKLAELAGEHKGELLKSNLVYYDTNKYDNKHVFYSIDTLQHAIEQKRQVSFYYFHRTIDGEKEYRKEKARYIINPLSLIFTQDRYYLVGYNDKYMDLSGYRIDRMENLAIEETAITPNKNCENFNIHKYTKETFMMYMGDLTRVELEADNEMSEEILDKFGGRLKIKTRGEKSFTIEVEIRLSPPFYSWITMSEGRIRIKSPKRVREGMREFLSHTNY